MTTTLGYWKLAEHPFRDSILRAESLGLFVDREDELYDIEDAFTHSRVIGVYGTLGVGKSSFLQKLKERASRSEIALAFVQLNPGSHETLFREILAELLELIRLGDITLKKGHGLKLDDHLIRLRASIATTSGTDLEGGIAVAKGKISRTRTTSAEPHTESTALSTIGRILDFLLTRLVVVLDDFEKIQYALPSNSVNYFPILARFIATLDQRLNREKVSFVISLDDRFSTLTGDARQRGGAFAFSLNTLIPLRNLEPQALVRFLTVRLASAGWKKSLASFLPLDSFWMLSLASHNHPRRALRILAEAMKYVAKRGTGNHLDRASILAACARTEEAVDERDLDIIDFLARTGGASESDRKFLKAAGLQSRSSLARRLTQLHGTLQLQVIKEKSGRTQKFVYSLPVLDYK